MLYPVELWVLGTQESYGFAVVASMSVARGVCLPILASFDPSTKLSVIGVAGFSAYTVFETDGTIRWSKPIVDYSSNLTGSSVFDFDGDGQSEVVYGDEYFLRIFRGTDGTVLYELPKSSGTTYELPVIADVDNDGNAEIIAVANGVQNGVYVIGDRNSTWVNTRKIWNQHSYHITNINDDGTIPTHEANSWQLYNSYRTNVLTDGFDPRSALDLQPTSVTQSTAPDDDVTFTATIANNGAPVTCIRRPQAAQVESACSKTTSLHTPLFGIRRAMIASVRKTRPTYLDRLPVPRADPSLKAGD
jgi:hypothetical protein